MIDRLALHRVTRNPKHHQQCYRQEHDHPKTHPVLIHRVHPLDVHQFCREVPCHETDGEEQDRHFGQQNGDPGELFDGL